MEFLDAYICALKPKICTADRTINPGEDLFLLKT